jgi:organic hydroperoxide reductase OsmC/OhrA
MSGNVHSYAVQVTWTGNRGSGTSGYTAYDRTHEITAVGKPAIPASSDPAFRGDPARYNPEDLLVASLSACHMLWYLNLCANAKVVVTGYVDDAAGRMTETPEGGGRFTEVVLRPAVTIERGSDVALATQLHDRAHHLCFIANSVNFDVRCEPHIEMAETDSSATSNAPTTGTVA